MIDLETVDKIFKDYASKFGFTNITIKKVWTHFKGKR